MWRLLYTNYVSKAGLKKKKDWLLIGARVVTLALRSSSKTQVAQCEDT